METTGQIQNAGHSARSLGGLLEVSNVTGNDWGGVL